MEESEAVRVQAEAAWKAAEDARVAVIQARDEAIASRDDVMILVDSLQKTHIEELKRISKEEERKLAVARENAITQFTSDL